MKTLVINKSAITVMLAAAFLVAALFVPFSVSAAPGKSAAAKAAKPSSSSIVQIVLANDNEFDVLQAAVVKAGLVDALSGTKQYTVFAPTDAAFISTLGVANEAAAIAAVEGMDNATLTNILLYHVMSGRHTSTSVLAKDSYRMLNGERLTKTELSDAGISAVNISARNGVIHVIDKVLNP